MDELIEKRDVEGLWRLYGQGALPFNAGMLRLAIEEDLKKVPNALELAVHIIMQHPVSAYTTPGIADTLLASQTGWVLFQYFIENNAEAVLRNDVSRFMVLGEHWNHILWRFPGKYRTRVFRVPGLMDCVAKYDNQWVFAKALNNAASRAEIDADPTYRHIMHYVTSRDEGFRNRGFRIFLMRRCTLALLGADGPLERLVKADGDWALIHSALAFMSYKWRRADGHWVWAYSEQAQ